MSVKRGEIVKARDFDDEPWNYGIYVGIERVQNAHSVMVLLNGHLRPTLFNKVEVVTISRVPKGGGK